MKEIKTGSGRCLSSEMLFPVYCHQYSSMYQFQPRQQIFKKYNLKPHCLQLHDIILRIWWIWASIFRGGFKIRTLNTAAKCCNNILEVWSLAKSTFPSIPSARLSGQVRANTLYSHIIQQTAAQTSFYHQDIWETGPPRRYSPLTSQWLILYGSALPISPSPRR